MSKLGCVCGHTITDQTDNIPYKAKFIRDQDFDEYSDKYTEDVASFIDAVKEGKRDEWIKMYFSETYPMNINNSSVVFDIVSVQRSRFEGELFQCETCGRVKIQVRDENLFASFTPEDDRYKDIFKNFSRVSDAS
jgi:hypothetical protein